MIGLAVMAAVSDRAQGRGARPGEPRSHRKRRDVGGARRPLWRPPLPWGRGLGPVRVRHRHHPHSLARGSRHPRWTLGWHARRSGRGSPAGHGARPMLDVAAPAIPLAQAIGRWGTSGVKSCSVGRRRCRGGCGSTSRTCPGILARYDVPSDLPVRVDVELGPLRRLVGAGPSRFHPAGQLFVVYLGGYFAGRFWIEGLRIDPAHVVGGLRWNRWVSIAVVAFVATATERQSSGTIRLPTLRTHVRVI